MLDRDDFEPGLRWSDVEQLVLTAKGDRVLDLLILGIIDAYPDRDGRSRESRLREINSILFGLKRKAGRAELNDIEALRYMAAEYASDRVFIQSWIANQRSGRSRGPRPKRRSVETLAESAVDLFNYPADTAELRETHIRRLAMSFTGRRVELIEQAISGGWGRDDEDNERMLASCLLKMFEHMGVPTCDSRIKPLVDCQLTEFADDEEALASITGMNE